MALAEFEEHRRIAAGRHHPPGRGIGFQAMILQPVTALRAADPVLAMQDKNGAAVRLQHRRGARQLLDPRCPLPDSSRNNRRRSRSAYRWLRRPRRRTGTSRSGIRAVSRSSDSPAEACIELDCPVLGSIRVTAGNDGTARPTRPENEPTSRTDRKRAAILAAATEIFLRQGYLGTSMDEVAARAAVSKQTVYKQFESKEALFVAIVRSMTGAAGDVIQREIADLGELDDPEKQLFAYAERQLLMVLTPRLMQLRRLVIGEAGQFPGAWPRVAGRWPGRAVAGAGGSPRPVDGSRPVVDRRSAGRCLALQLAGDGRTGEPRDVPGRCGDSRASGAPLPRGRGRPGVLRCLWQFGASSRSDPFAPPRAEVGFIDTLPRPPCATCDSIGIRRCGRLSLSRIIWTWFFTVAGLMLSAQAISLLDMPSSTSEAIYRARAASASRRLRGARARRVARRAEAAVWSIGAGIPGFRSARAWLPGSGR